MQKIRGIFGKSLEHGHDHRQCTMQRYLGRVNRQSFQRLEQDKSQRESISRGLVKDLAILFADIRGFTRRTEQMPPDRIVTLLDVFIPEMLHIVIERHKGTVDKLLGDGIMALYGHPYDEGNRQLQALYSAVDMHQAATAMGQVLELMGYDPIELGIGINFGEVLICEVGNHEYREATVIGAPVNLAAKMEDTAAANEIVLPEDSALQITDLKPDLKSFFVPREQKASGVSTVSFRWTDFLSSGPREFADWEAAGA